MSSADPRERSQGFAAVLTDVARRSIACGVETGRPLEVDPVAFSPDLRKLRATFVTLRRNAALRGCIGSLRPRSPLVVSVAENAYRAAFRDPRFPPLPPHEIADLEVEISLIGPLEKVAVRSEDDLLARLRPGIDGVVLWNGSQSGTFLPAVWKDLPDPAIFLRALKRKAGLPEEAWPDGMEVHRFTADRVA
ncbi:MAG: AmmeMemoRadiSam system protein A [Myxococcota bacterium]